MSDTSSHSTRLAITAAVCAGAAVAVGWYHRCEFPALLVSGSASKKKKAKKKKKSSGPSNAIATTSVTSTAPGSAGGSSVYETKKAIDEYVQFHFGSPTDVLPYRDGPREALRFTQRCADLCAKHCKSVTSGKWQVAGGSNDDLRDMLNGKSTDPTSPHLQRPVRPGIALDVGCAVGGASFELTKHFRDVVGVDFSKAFITTAIVMKQRGGLTYKATIEGDIQVTRNTHELNPRIDRTRVEFKIADACALPKSMLGGGGPVGKSSSSELLETISVENTALFHQYGRYDAVLAANLLCRLPDPILFINDCARLVRPNGVLVLVSPYSWLEQWTPKAKWMGGVMDGKNKVKSFDVVKEVLESEQGGFDLVDETDLPFLIKEHDRKFQWGVSHATVWRRRKPRNNRNEREFFN